MPAVAWRGSVFARGRKLWLKVKTPEGWKNLPTQFHVGEETKARALLARVRDRLLAGEELDDGLQGRVTVRRWSAKWCEKRRGTIEDAGGDEARIRDHVLPALGDMALEDVRARHTVAIVDKLKAHGYAPRTIRNVYYALKAMFRDAVVEGHIDSSPCILGRAQLPEIVDADPEWRSSAIYARAEIVALVTDPRIPVDELVFHSILGLGGLRLGEGCGIRWRNVDLDMSPLGRFVIARSYMKRGTKTKRTRWMPIHPALAPILREWFERGWESVYGRPPGPDDLVVPTPPPAKGKGRRTPAGQMRTKSYAEKHFWKVLDLLGLPHRRVHDLRRAFISHARDDGADKDILRRGTHQPPKDVMELYTTVEWRKLCKEVARLKVKLPTQVPKKTKPAARRSGGLGTVLGTVSANPQ